MVEGVASSWLSQNYLPEEQDRSQQELRESDEGRTFLHSFEQPCTHKSCPQVAKAMSLFFLSLDSKVGNVPEYVDEQ
ncbi:hypothetical protein CC2G_000062 [Coprinopsis cinerea AmutBmut pab1-1]|nr:hypothetical protein CC2G_000062 [Coprinopsis cinerea AmutBmut pab1-1]